MTDSAPEPSSLSEPLPAPPAPSPLPIQRSADHSPKKTDQETDLWWGSYSGWTMFPSFLVCLVLTALIGWLAWALVRGGLLAPDLLKLTFLGAAGALWLGQFTRWGLRFFGFNYRLTTRRLFKERGYLQPHRVQVKLEHVADVGVERTGIEQLAGVGRVILHRADRSYPPVVLEGVRQPLLVADLIRQALQKAKEPKTPVK